MGSRTGSPIHTECYLSPSPPLLRTSRLLQNKGACRASIRLVLLHKGVCYLLHACGGRNQRDRGAAAHLAGWDGVGRLGQWASGEGMLKGGRRTRLRAPRPAAGGPHLAPPSSARHAAAARDAGVPRRTTRPKLRVWSVTRMGSSASAAVGKGVGGGSERRQHLPQGAAGVRAGRAGGRSGCAVRHQRRCICAVSFWEEPFDSKPVGRVTNQYRTASRRRPTSEVLDRVVQHHVEQLVVAFEYAADWGVGEW